jgi:putative endonuclease
MIHKYGDFESLNHRKYEVSVTLGNTLSHRNNNKRNMKGYMYILECADGTYYTGSTVNIEKRCLEHQNGEGANHTKKRLPVRLVYYEEFDRIDHAFYREKQIQGWCRKKKEALILGNPNILPELSIAYRDLKKLENGDFESLNHREEDVAKSSANTSNNSTNAVSEVLEDTANNNNKLNTQIL